MNRKLYIQATPEQELLFCFSEMEILSPNNCGDFWQLWLSYQDDFYNLCRKWMGGNCHDAEDALNQAMLKAWNEWKKSANKITYTKAWLTRIIHNLCMDVHRKRKREAKGIENIDDIKFAEHQEFAASVEIPDSNILTLEMQAYLHHQIESLPDRLRHPFILHCCQDKSYQNVAKQLTISEENVRKRILKARKILQKQLKKYLAGEDNTCIDFLSPALKKDISMGEKWQSDETVICDWESLIPTNSKQEEINYSRCSLPANEP
jgi:RNA polymerase sigma-70 factor (ECF subfamily)